MLTHVPVLLRGEVGELGQMEGYREGVFRFVLLLIILVLVHNEFSSFCKAESV